MGDRVGTVRPGVRLPNGDRATVDIAKLTDYILSVKHEEGQHKARTIRAALGIGPENADVLQRILLAHARDGEAQLGRGDQHGQRYVVDVIMPGRTPAVVLRSAWIVDEGSDVPRFVSCYLRRVRRVAD